MDLDGLLNPEPVRPKIESSAPRDPFSAPSTTTNKAHDHETTPDPMKESMEGVDDGDAHAKASDSPDAGSPHGSGSEASAQQQRNSTRSTRFGTSSSSPSDSSGNGNSGTPTSSGSTSSGSSANGEDESREEGEALLAFLARGEHHHHHHHHYHDDDGGDDDDDGDHHHDHHNHHSEPPKRRRGRPRRRQNLSHEQTVTLEAAFERSAYPTKAEREALAHCTRLSYRKVLKWFDNRRTKERKRHGKLRGSPSSSSRSSDMDVPPLKRYRSSSDSGSTEATSSYDSTATPSASSRSRRGSVSAVLTSALEHSNPRFAAFSCSNLGAIPGVQMHERMLKRFEHWRTWLTARMEEWGYGEASRLAMIVETKRILPLFSYTGESRLQQGTAAHHFGQIRVSNLVMSSPLQQSDVLLPLNVTWETHQVVQSNVRYGHAVMERISISWVDPKAVVGNMGLRCVRDIRVGAQPETGPVTVHTWGIMTTLKASLDTTLPDNVLIHLLLFLAEVEASPVWIRSAVEQHASM